MVYTGEGCTRTVHDVSLYVSKKHIAEMPKDSELPKGGLSTQVQTKKPMNNK